MAHNLEMNADGTARIFYVGEKPWHGLGTALNEPPSIEDGLKYAGLDWTVSKVPLTGLVGHDAEGKEIRVTTDQCAVVRSGDNKVLGVVGETYETLNNLSAFNFFQPAIENKLVSLEAAGSLRGGSRIWVLGRINNTTTEIVPGDPMTAYCMLSSSHDGSLAVNVGHTQIRAICENTVNAALASDNSKFLKVRHTKNMAKALETIQEIIDYRKRTFAATVEQFKYLASVGCDDETLRKYVEMVFEPEIKNRAANKNGDNEESAEKSYDKLYEKVVPLFEKGRGNDLPGVKGSMWAALNSVTEMLTWERGRSNDTRLDALWFGASKKTNERAFDAALSLAKAA